MYHAHAWRLEEDAESPGDLCHRWQLETGMWVLTVKSGSSNSPAWRWCILNMCSPKTLASSQVLSSLKLFWALARSLVTEAGRHRQDLTSLFLGSGRSFNGQGAIGNRQQISRFYGSKILWRKRALSCVPAFTLMTKNKLEVGVTRRQSGRVSRDCGKPSGMLDFLSRSLVASKTT